MKNIFTKTLTLIAFLSLSAGLWGETFSYDFTWSSKKEGNSGIAYISDDGNYTYQTNSGTWWKGTDDGDFLWSQKIEDYVKNSMVPSYTSLGSDAYFRSRNTHSFNKGTYTIVINFRADENGPSVNTPSFYVGSYQATTSTSSVSFNDGNKGTEVPVEYTVTIETAGDYYFQGRFNKQEKVGFKTATFTKAGPVAMKRIYMPKTTFNDWTAASAKFAVYCITDNKWQDHYMTSGTGCLADYYYDDIPETCEKVIIGRFNPSSNPPFGWGDSDNKPWNQTVDVTLGSNNCVAPKNEKEGDKYKCNLSTFTPPTYAVTYAPGAHGSGKMTDSNSPYACGSDVTVLENEFEAARGYVFKNFSDGSKTYDAGDVISDLQANKTLTAQWTALKSYTITASADPSHKGHVTGVGTYYEGETITLTAVSEDANKYMFDGWSDGNTSNPRVFTAQSGITTNYVANFISGKKECGKNLTIECEDFVAVTLVSDATATNGSALSKDKSGYSGRGTVRGLDDQATEIYLPFTLTESESNLQIVLRYAEANANSFVNIFKETNGSGNIQYQGINYEKIHYDKIMKAGSDYEWNWPNDLCNASTLTKNLQAGNYIISVYNKEGKGHFDKIDFTATKDIFCTITPAAKCTISYAMNGHGTAIGDVLIEEGETWTAPTPDPTADGWVFDGWKRPNGTGDETLYKSGDAGFTISGNETLTAQWSEDLSTVWYMKGTFNGEDWGTQHDFVKKTGESTGNIAYVTLNNLNAGYDYYFLVWDNNKHGCTVDGAKITKDNNEWTLDGSNNVGLTTTAKGSYTFTLDFTDANNPQITVTYPTDYTITFDNGNSSATGTMNNMVNIAENEKVTLTANNYALGCNHFVKWKDQDDNEYEDGAQVTVTKDLTLTAQWAVNRYKAIYDANGVTGYTGDLPATVEYDCGDQVTVSQTPKLSKFGYTFIGWNTNPAATEALEDDYQFTIDQGDTKIYAIWSATKPLSITIAPATGGNNPTKGTGVQMNATLDPDASTMAEENRALTWSSSDATRAFINQQGQVSFVGTGEVTITATSNVDNNVKGNYIFYVQAGNCDGLKIRAYGNSYQVDDYFHPISYGANEWRCPYVLKSGGDHFWVGECNNDAGGWQGDHSEEKSFNDIPLRDYRDVKTNPAQDLVGTLVIWNNSGDKNYGICFEPTYQVSYMTDASTWRIMEFYPTSEAYAYETELLQVPDGYKNNSNMKYFVGLKKADGTNVSIYNKSREDAMNSVSGLSSADMAGKFGKWHIISNSGYMNWDCQFTRYYQVRFEMNGGDGNIDPMYFVGDNLQSFNTNTLTNPTRTGYELTGWKDQEDNTYTTSQSITVAKDLVLTAQWTAKDYAITLDKNNGSTDGSASAKYDSNTLNSISHVGNRTGYTLSGYFTLAENGSKVITAEGTLVASVLDYTDESSKWKKASNCTLYAQWTANKYNVNLDFDGGTSGKTSVEATYDAAMPSAAPLPTREFYNFAGYFTAKNGEGTKYYNADGTSAHAWDITTNNTTLYAYWTPKSYAITWEFAGGHATDENYTKGDVPYGSTITAPTVEKTGYNFTGWNPAVGTMPGAPATYTAQWTAKTYTLTLDKNGGSSDGQVKVTYDSNLTSNFSAPTRDNYVIEGFYAENTYTTKVMNADGTLCTSVENYTDASGNWVNTTCTTLYTKWTVDYCDNTLTIQCEDDIIRSGLNVGSEGSTPDGMRVIPDDEGPYYKYPNYTGRGYIDLKGNTGATYYAVHLPAATYSFDIYKTNGGNKKLRLYSKSYGSDGNNISYNGTTYKRIFSDQYSTGDSDGSFTSATVSNKTLQEDDYIVALYSEGWAAYDQIVITANSKVFCPEMYEVNFAANPSDKATVTAQIKGETITSGTEVPENTVVVFTASDITSGYELVNWTDDSGNELAGAVASFEQKITSDTTVNANIALIQPKYAVTATASDEHGTITSGEGEYREGATVTIVTTPATNYKVGSATASNVNEFSIDGNNVSFTMPAAPVAVTINFVFDEVHALIITPNSSETYTFGDKEGWASTFDISSVADPTGTFDHNVLKLEYDGMNDNYAGRSISKDAGYAPNAKATGFAFWYRTEKSDDGIAFCFQKTEGNQTKWQMQATNGEWRYYYWEDNAAANYATNANFKIYMNGKDGDATTKYNSGTYYITEIQATNVTEMSPIVPPVDLTVVVSPNEGGTVTTSPETTTGLAKGTEVTLTATPEDNYRFVNWTVNDVEVSTEATYSRIVNATETITANFVRVYTLTINNDDGHGTATVSPNQTKFAEGDEITVTSVPNSGYKFKEWLNGSEKQESTEDPYTFTMPASDKTLKVTFEESINYYDINTSVSGEGIVTIKVNGETHTGQQILEGTQVTLTATPNSESYAFTQWQDGNTDNPRTITVTENATYTAVFAPVYTVSVELGKPGKEVIGVGKYAGGAQVTLTAVANTKDSQDKTYDLEYQLKEWTAMSGISITGHEYDNPLTFGMPYKDVSLKATFAPVECVDSLIIQCEDINAFIPATAQGEAHDLPLAPHHIPDKDGCGTKTDYYYGWHGDGYYDYRNNTNCEMYYPVFLQAGTYQFSVWAATDENKNCSINIYKRTDGTPVLTYKAVDYSRIATAAANNSYKKEGENYVTFQEVGIIQNVVVETEQLIIVGLHCGNNYGTFDQIKIKGTTKVFCAPLPTTDFVINAGETKEIPVCGVDNLTIYDGGQANNNDDVEVFKQVKYSRTVKELDKWETFAVPYNANDITVQDIPHKDFTEYVINPIYGEEGKYTAGYFYMEELKGEDATLMGRPFASRWEISLTQYPQQNVPYIIRFPREQSNGYFANTQINYKYDYTRAGGASVILTGKKNATIIEEDYLGLEEKPTFYFYANNTLADIQLQTSAYILNESGMNFDIVDQPVIPPFHCYIQAIQEIKQLYPHLVMRNDGGGTTILIPMRADELDSLNAKKVMIDEVIYIVREGKIYTVMGQLVK